MTTIEAVAAEEAGERREPVESTELEHVSLSVLVALVARGRPRSEARASSNARAATGGEARAETGPLRGETTIQLGERVPESRGTTSVLAEAAPGPRIEEEGTVAVGLACPHSRRLAELARSSRHRIAVHFGLDDEAATRVAAAFELGRRVERSRRDATRSLRSPDAVHELMLPELRGVQRECFHVLLLDGKHRLKQRERISEGTLTQSLVHPREVFAPALRECAAALIVVHNHPSGDPEPSREDLLVTRRLIETGEILGIPLLDHVVIADESYVSLRERMKFA